MKNIILIGFMGVGKGMVARALSHESEMFTIDTDDLIESFENQKIKDIFKSKGEKYFRTLEEKTAKWLEQYVCNTIISTGGGFYAVKNLKKIGHIILLDAPFDYIYQQILAYPNAQEELEKRPLFQDEKKAKKLYATRLAAYKKVADTTIHVEGKTPKAVAKEILKIDF